MTTSTTIILLAGLSEQAPPPSEPAHDPWAAYVISAVAVLVFYAGTRVDADLSGPRRRPLTRGLFALAAVLMLIGLGVGVRG